MLLKNNPALKTPFIVSVGTDILTPRTLVIIRGLPGSGKTTLANELEATLSEKSFHYEADQYFVNDKGTYVFDPTQIKDAHATCQSKILAALRQGLPYVLVSNTFTQWWEMEAYVTMARELGYNLTVLECKENFGNVHGVPEEHIERMAGRWENLTEKISLG